MVIFHSYVSLRRVSWIVVWITFGLRRYWSELLGIRTNKHNWDTSPARIGCLCGGKRCQHLQAGLSTKIRDTLAIWRKLGDQPSIFWGCTILRTYMIRFFISLYTSIWPLLHPIIWLANSLWHDMEPMQLGQPRLQHRFQHTHKTWPVPSQKFGNKSLEFLGSRTFQRWNVCELQDMTDEY